MSPAVSRFHDPPDHELRSTLVGCVSDKIPIQPVGGNTQTVVAVSGNLVSACADRPNPVDLHQSTDSALTNIKACFLPLHRHPRSSITAKAQRILLADMRQHGHVCPLTRAAGSHPPGSIATLADAHHPAQCCHPPLMPPGINKREPHGLADMIPRIIPRRLPWRRTAQSALGLF